jgi:hypothetical protein
LLLRLGEMPCPPRPPRAPAGRARRRRTIREAEKVVWSWCDPRESLAGPGAARPLCFHFGGHGGGGARCSMSNTRASNNDDMKCRKSMAHGGSEAHPPSPALRSDSARPAGLRGTAVRHTGRRVSRRRAARARLYCTAVWGRKAPGVVQITVKETCPTQSSQLSEFASRDRGVAQPRQDSEPQSQTFSAAPLQQSRRPSGNGATHRRNVASP